MRAAQTARFRGLLNISEKPNTPPKLVIIEYAEYLLFRQRGESKGDIPAVNIFRRYGGAITLVQHCNPAITQVFYGIVGIKQNCQFLHGVLL